MLEAISNRKARFPIQKHQKITAIFHQFFKSKQTTEGSAQNALRTSNRLI
jgi:hypothetical protein